MNTIITIGREFGSGGRELARRLAVELGYEYYDKEIITEIAKKTSLSEDYVQEVIEKKPHNLYPITIGRSINYVEDFHLKQIQNIYQAQTDIIKDLAMKSSCVIVGRCADYILEDLKPYRIFIYASLDSRIKRCMLRLNENETYTEKQIAKKIKKIDKERAKYYSYYTGKKWGQRHNYDLCINTTNCVIKEIIPAISQIFK